MKHLLLLIVPLGLLLLQTPAQASHQEFIRVQSVDNSIDFELSVGDTVGGVSIAFADLGDDGISEIIVGSGLGSEPRVRVLRQDGSEVGSFLAYAPSLGVGVNVAACDLTGDGYNEIIVAPGRGGGPHVRVFDRYGESIDDGGFFAYDESFRGGINLACGDLIDDARDELVTLPAASGGPHVRVWSWNGQARLAENFFAFHASDRSGLVGDVHNEELIVAQQHTNEPTIKTFSFSNSITTTNEQTRFVDALGITSLVAHAEEIILSTATNSLVYTTDETSETFSSAHGSVTVASDEEQLLVTSGRLIFVPEEHKRIEVDTLGQRLYASDGGILDNSFLISSGLNNATPLGNHVILAKVPVVHYAWNYGEGDPRNYDLGWIPYNIRFYPHIYIHYAPWHNNFGHKMSHGCVNVSLEDMMWIYEWSDEGIEVMVHEKQS